MRQTVLSDSSNTIVPNTVTEELEPKMTVTAFSIKYFFDFFFAFHIFPINNKWAESTELFLLYCFNLSEEFTAEHVKTTVNTKTDSEQMDILLNLLKPAQSSPL